MGDPASSGFEGRCLDTRSTALPGRARYFLKKKGDKALGLHAGEPSAIHRRSLACHGWRRGKLQWIIDDDDAGTATGPFHGKAIHASPPEWFGGNLSAGADPLGQAICVCRSRRDTSCPHLRSQRPPPLLYPLSSPINPYPSILIPSLFPLSRFIHFLSFIVVRSFTFVFSFTHLKGKHLRHQLPSKTHSFI